MKKSLFETALDEADKVMTHVSASMLSRATPCAEWNMQQLLNHMYNELAWVPELLAGKTIDQVGKALDGDLVGDDLHASWRGYADAARAAATKTPPEKVVHLSYGNVPASNYLNEMAADITVHTWDVAKAVGIDFHIDSTLAEAVYEQTKDHIGTWRKSGLVGQETPLPLDATAEARLISMFGRRP